jgi:D-psicose/D-tagatose/L-ribulose 3-epimerase
MTNCFGLLEKVAKMGYDIVEIAVEDKDLIDWKSLKKIADDLGLSITISGAFGEARDLSSENIAYRKNSFNYIVDCIQIAEKMGSPIFTGPVYSAVGKTRYTTLEVKKQENAWCVEGLYKLGEIAKIMVLL